jgi:hypothetical protein
LVIAYAFRTRAVPTAAAWWRCIVVVPLIESSLLEVVTSPEAGTHWCALTGNHARLAPVKPFSGLR